MLAVAGSTCSVVPVCLCLPAAAACCCCLLLLLGAASQPPSWERSIWCHSAMTLVRCGLDVHSIGIRHSMPACICSCWAVGSSIVINLECHSCQQLDNSCIIIRCNVQRCIGASDCLDRRTCGVLFMAWRMHILLKLSSDCNFQSL